MGDARDPINPIKGLISVGLAATDDPAPPKRGRKKKPPPPLDDGVDDGGDGSRGPSHLRLTPDDAPIYFLGVKGDNHYYLKDNGEIAILKTKDHQSWANLYGLYSGHEGFLIGGFPVYDREGQVRPHKWAGRDVGEWTLKWSYAAGWFDLGLVRGAGVWKHEPDDDERDPPSLVCHCGDVIYLVWPGLPLQSCDPGWIGKRLYPRRMPRQMAPAAQGATQEETMRLLALLQRWTWTRGRLDAILLMGWIAVGMVTGALDWRPAIWVTGDAGSGKTTLQALVGRIMGNLLLAVTDATEAGLRQELSGGARPVAFDEIESGEREQAVGGLLHLMRMGASVGGGRIIRHSADGTDGAAKYDVAFNAWFSGIIPPSIEPQDAARITFLTLGGRREAGGDRSGLHKEMGWAAGLGPRLRRRLLDRWGVVDQMRGAFADALARDGHDARASDDQLGTLLGMGWALTYDAPPCPDEWDELLNPIKPDVLARERDDATAGERCLRYLLTSRVGKWSGGDQRTVREVILAAIGSLMNDVRIDSRKTLGRMGIGIYPIKAGQTPTHLLVSIADQGTAALYSESGWAAKGGGQGPWTTALRRLPGHQVPPNPMRIGAGHSRCTMVPLGLCFPDGLDDAIKAMFADDQDADALV